MIALIILICGAILTVTQTYLWLWLVISLCIGILLWYRQWLELLMSVFLLVQVSCLPMVTPLTTKQPQQVLSVIIISMPTKTTNGCKAYGHIADTKWLITQRADMCTLTYGASMEV
ncbi:MAG: hypothetical protein ACRC3A_03065, partial [Culicoidibacterales bacterium]